MTRKPLLHRPVMVTEAMELLNIRPGQWYLDATFGGGGHASEIIKRGGSVIGVDWDDTAIAAAIEHFGKEIQTSRLILERSSFTHLDQVVTSHQEKITDGITGILFDFGTNATQLTSTERGFSFEGDGPLDMRMDTRLGVTAADVLNFSSEKQLAQLFQEYGDEPQARAIAKAIKQSPTPITTSAQLAQLIVKVKHNKRDHLHPATKVFQALRIAVNTELENIEEALPLALALLNAHGRLVTIAFHEGEDRIAKNVFKQWEENRLVTVLTKKPLQPDSSEVNINPRSRSAKLRAVEKGVASV